MDYINEIRKNIKLKGEVEADDTYETINLKETKKESMPKLFKPHYTKDESKREISNYQICIASVIDEFDNCFFEIVGIGPILSE